MKTSIEPIPTWALPYICNGDPSGLTDEEITMVDDYLRDNNINDVCPRYNEEMETEPYFTYYPCFGKACDVEDCDVIYNEDAIAIANAA